VSGLRIPRRLAEEARREGRDAWLAGIPATVHRLRDRWSLDVGDPFEPGGQTAWVAPAGPDTVLKVAWRHYEAEHEADGLRVWDGDGAVRLLAADTSDDTSALLLERCRPGTDLAGLPEPEQDVVIATLLGRLWREPPPRHPFRPLASMCDAWADESEAKPATADPGLVREGLALFRELPRTADRAVLLCTDLHAGNVLAAEREPWLVIDPKPYLGDPSYDALQHMLNCDERLRADPRGLASRMADLLGLEPDRLLLWLFARCVQESPDRPALADVAWKLRAACSGSAG
jgi:streptomycin 6-kinase